MWVFSVLAVLAGAAISFQASMNARLGVILKNPLLATSIAFIVASLMTFMFMLGYQRQLPNIVNANSIPTYLWFGGAFSAFGVGSYYYLIPKMGLGNMMSLALTGQLVLAILASHYGWFEQPIKPINLRVILGVLAMTLGVILINGGQKSGY